MSPSLDRVAGPLATAVGVGGLLYGLLFIWIVEGATDWVPEVWHALLIVGGLLTIPVTVALYQVVRVTDEGLALTALLVGFAGALGGVAHGAWNLAAISEYPAVLVLARERCAHGGLTAVAPSSSASPGREDQPIRVTSSRFVFQIE